MAFNFFEEALRASGANTEELELYARKLRLLEEGLPRRGNSARVRGEALFQGLWEKRHHRYNPGGNFRLTDVIDCQLDPTAESVGNCLGLTLLFNGLAQRLGLKVAALYMEEAFDRGPHVLSLIYTEDGPLQVENILPGGFDYKSHKNQSQTIWGDKELVADIYNSRGTECFLKGNLEEALACYKKALHFNEGYLKARLNLGVTLVQLGKEKEARRYFI